MPLAVGQYSQPCDKPLRATRTCPGCQSVLFPGSTGHRYYRTGESEPWQVVCPSCYGNGYKPGETSNGAPPDEPEAIAATSDNGTDEAAPVTVEPLHRVTLAGKHRQAVEVLAVMLAGRYPFLYGAPGAGKTHLIQSIAHEAGLPFLLLTLTVDSLSSQLIGNVSPINGQYYGTKFRQCWEHGGVILFDETCLAPGHLLNTLNAALEQQVIEFPDKQQITRHPHCYLVFADNSSGYGNDPLFPERQDIGQAMRDRLTYIDFTYDEALEVRIITACFKGNVRRAQLWHTAVLAMRQALTSAMLPVFASPRFAYRAAEWYQRGVFKPDQIFTMELRRGVPADVWQQCQAIIKPYLKVW